MSQNNDTILLDDRGLVAEYLLDGNALDTSGNGYNGTASNVTYAKTHRGYQSQCGVFNGSSSKIDTTFAGLTNNFSISMVLTRGDSDGVAFSMHNAWCRISSDGAVQANFYDGADRSISSSTGYVTDTGLHHLVWVKTSTNGQALWLDGVKVAENTSHNGTLSTYTGTPGIGYFRAFSGHYTSGQIQSVRIFNRALSATEIRNRYLESLRQLGGSSLYGLMDGLVATYDMKGDSLDVIGGNDPTSVGTSVTKSTGRFGESDGSMNFPGTDSQNRIVLGNVLNMSSGFTVNAWIYVTDSSAAYQRIFGRISSNNSTSQFVLGKNGASIYAAVFNGGTQYYIDNLGTIPTNQWSMVSIKWTPSTLTGYVNGVSVGSVGTSSSINSGSLDNAVIGGDAADSYTAGRFKGKIARIEVYNVGKDDSQIKAIYELSSKRDILPFDVDGRKGLPPQLKANCKLWLTGDYSGTTAFDASGNGNHGTLVNSPTPKRRGGYKGNLYDGSTQYLTAPVSRSGAYSYAFTFEPKVAQSGSFRMAIGLTDVGLANGYSTFSYDHSSSTYRNAHYVYNGSAFFSCRTTTVPQVGKKYRIVCTYDGNTNGLIKVAVNGRIENSVAITGNVVASSNVCVGSQIPSFGPLTPCCTAGKINAEIYDTVFLDKAMSADEIKMDAANFFIPS